MSITPAQSRAGRGLVDWTQSKLAETSNLGVSTIKNFEAARSIPTINNLAAIRAALEAAGVEFIAENGGGPGVRLRKSGAAADSAILIEDLNAQNDE
jgi:transcriptional regulator with XRE-family HTH domain